MPHTFLGWKGKDGHVPTGTDRTLAGGAEAPPSRVARRQKGRGTRETGARRRQGSGRGSAQLAFICQGTWTTSGIRDRSRPQVHVPSEKEQPRCRVSRGGSTARAPTAGDRRGRKGRGSIDHLNKRGDGAERKVNGPRANPAAAGRDAGDPAGSRDLRFGLATRSAPRIAEHPCRVRALLFRCLLSLGSAKVPPGRSRRR